MSRANKRSKKANNKGKYFLIGGLVALVALTGAYAYRSSYYATHYLPNTYVEGMDISNLTVTEVDQLLHDRYTSEEFTLTIDANEWKTLNKADFGLQTDFGKELEDLQEEQNNWSWPIAHFNNQELSLGDAAFDEATFDEQKAIVEEELLALNEDRTPTKNATIVKNEDGFMIQPEENGTELNVAEILEDLNPTLFTTSDSLELEDFKKEATITQEDEKLQSEIAELNKIAHVTATYVINGDSFQVPTENITDWLSYNDEEVELDREKVLAYVTDVANNYNTSTNPTTFQSTRQGEVSVPAGTLSWTIATETETDGLIADLLNGEDFTRSPIAQGSASSSAPLVGNTYVEVDLENQYMWYYKDGEVVLQTDIVSGKPTTVTPKGVFYVWKKERNSTLRGTNDDGTKYATPVDYWLPIDWTGVGIHDANWQPNFGGNLWQTAGSHGCVNTPPNVMKTLYEKIEVGTPVIVL